MHEHRHLIATETAQKKAAGGSLRFAIIPLSFSCGIMRLLLVLSILLIGSNFVNACPGAVTQVCLCAELHNGVVLDCSKTDGYETMKLLQNNQALLGLIQSLSMQNSNLESIPKSFFSGLFIKKLDLSNNGMKYIDDQAFEGINSVLQELVITHNKLQKLPSKAIANLPMLLRLDISNNTISDINEGDVFPSLTKIYDINLGSNNISTIHTSTFQNVKNTIQTINLGHNKLAAVPSSAIRGLKQLQSLHLHHNQIKQLEALTFLNLPVLNLLNLAGNEIHDLNRQAFLNVPNLRYLYLTDNKITKLMSHQFASFDQLEMLDLTHNQLTDIPNECLSGLKQLRQLYLGNNQIKKIGANAFSNSSIVILVLSGNQLADLPEGVITGLANLQQVSFRDNQIKIVHQNAFYNAPSLAMIDLAKNQLTDIAPSTFLAQLNLLLIDLSENKLTKTPYAAFNRRVGTVLLKENPLVCTEKIHMLQDGTGINIEDSDDIICGGIKKTTTTTTTQQPSLVQVPKLLPNKQLLDASRATSQMNDQEIQQPQIPSGAFQQAGLVKPPATSRAHSRFIHHNGSGVPRISLSGKSSEDKVNDRIDPTPPIQDFVLDDSNQKEIPLIKPDVLPTREDQEHSIQSLQTTTNRPRAVTDIADNPNIIHPFPVPFLKRGPHMNKASVVKGPIDTSTENVLHTLPPSILIEPGSTPKFNSSQAPESARVNTEKYEEFALRSQSNSEEPSTPVVPQQKYMFPTTIVIICVGTALIVMIAVILGLCISKHRQLRFENSYSDSSVARTNEYVAAQAQLNSVYNTHNPRVGRFEDSPAWIYNPGANYCNYYK